MIKSFVFVKMTLITSLIGLLVGCACAAFLFLLEQTTQMHSQNSRILFLLPLAGLLIVWQYQKWGNGMASNDFLTKQSFHSDSTKSLKAIILLFINTLLTHLVGGSAGRESTAVKVGLGLAAKVAQLLKVPDSNQNIFLISGLAAGFSSAIGVPWAGLIFALELSKSNLHRWENIFYPLLTSFIAYRAVHVLGIAHVNYPKVNLPWLDLKLLLIAIVFAIILSFTGKLYLQSKNLMTKVLAMLFTNSYYKIFFGGILLIGFFYWEGSFRYNGLGLDVISSSFLESPKAMDPIYKIFFTVLTLSLGFKGGEFTPLVFIGVTAGALLQFQTIGLIDIPFAFLPALGFGALYGSVARVPFACTIMLIEIFGYDISVYALICCSSSYFISKKIY